MAEKDYKNGQNISPIFSTNKEMIAWLHSPDAIPDAKKAKNSL